MHDALAAERQGIPAAAIMTDRFEASARAFAELHGVPDYPFVVIAHPIASDGDAALAAKAEIALAGIVALLTRRSAQP